LNSAAILGLEIPRLSFLLIRESENSYICTCIHLRTDGYGKTEENAFLDMIDNAYYFLRENFGNPKCKDKAWENLEELFVCDDWTSELWNLYHKVQLILAIQGKSADNFEVLKKKIDAMEKRIAKLESSEAKSLAEKISELKKNMTFGYVTISEREAA
jgi:uncharacterized protein YdcH (DUF465 family)